MVLNFRVQAKTQNIIELYNISITFQMLQKILFPQIIITANFDTTSFFQTLQSFINIPN